MNKTLMTVLIYVSFEELVLMTYCSMWPVLACCGIARTSARNSGERLIVLSILGSYGHEHSG